MKKLAVVLAVVFVGSLVVSMQADAGIEPAKEELMKEIKNLLPADNKIGNLNEIVEELRRVLGSLEDVNFEKPTVDSLAKEELMKEIKNLLPADNKIGNLNEIVEELRRVLGSLEDVNFEKPTPDPLAEELRRFKGVLDEAPVAGGDPVIPTVIDTDIFLR